jgi:hypothetical protein
LTSVAIVVSISIPFSASAIPMYIDAAAVGEIIFSIL